MRIIKKILRRRNALRKKDEVRKMELGLEEEYLKDMNSLAIYGSTLAASKDIPWNICILQGTKLCPYAEYVTSTPDQKSHGILSNPIHSSDLAFCGCDTCPTCDEMWLI